MVTVGTVKKHVFNVRAKLGARNRTQAIARARALYRLYMTGGSIQSGACSEDGNQPHLTAARCALRDRRGSRTGSYHQM